MPRKALNPRQLGQPTLTRVTKNSNGKYVADPTGAYWEARVRVGQLSGQPRLFRRVGKTRQQALDAAIRAAQDYANTGATPYSAKTTLNDLWEQHLSTHSWERLSPYTKRSYSKAKKYSQQLQPRLWSTPVATLLIDNPWQRHFHDLAQKRGSWIAKAAKKAIDRIIEAHKDRINVDSFTRATVPMGITTRPTGNDPRRVFSQEEFTTLRKSLYRQAGALELLIEKTAALLYVNTYLGLRQSELRLLTPENFNDDWTVIYVRSYKTKSDYPPKPLPEWVQDMFHRLEDARTSDSFFGGKEATFAAYCTRILDRAGFEWASSHTIRRTVGSIIFDKKGIRVAARWLAHANVQTTIEHYIRLDQSVGDEPVDF